MFSSKNERYGSLCIVGANSDIAKQFVINYGNLFHSVTLASRNTSSLELFRKQNKLDNCVVSSLDITDTNSLTGFFQSTPCPEVLIFCAGHIRYGETSELNCAENIEATCRINFECAVKVLEHFTALMSEEKKGRIIVLSSAADARGKYSNRIYSASKAALTVYTEGLMQKYSCSPVISLVKPGRVRTKMLSEFPLENPAFVCSAGRVSGFIHKLLKKRSSGIYYCPFFWKFICVTVKMIPQKIYGKIHF